MVQSAALERFFCSCTNQSGGATVYYKVTVILQRQPERVYTVTCKELPELVTEGETMEEALDNAVDALISTLEIYEELGRPLPDEILVKDIPIEASNAKFQTMTPREDNSDLWFQATVPPKEVAVHAL